MDVKLKLDGQSYFFVKNEKKANKKQNINEMRNSDHARRRSELRQSYL